VSEHSNRGDAAEAGLGARKRPLAGMVFVALIGCCLFVALGLAWIFTGRAGDGWLLVGVFGALAIANGVVLALSRRSTAPPAPHARPHRQGTWAWFLRMDDRVWDASTSNKGQRIILVASACMVVAITIAKAVGKW
jgi:hypothetical protein